MDDYQYSLNQWIDLNIIDLDVERLCSDTIGNLFDSAFFTNLYKICYKYGIVVRLYFSRIDDLKNLFTSNEKVISQIRKQSSWIKIGWLQPHGSEYNDCTDIIDDINSFFEFGYRELGNGLMGASSVITEKAPDELLESHILTGHHRFLILPNLDLTKHSLNTNKSYIQYGYYIDGKCEYRKVDFVVDSLSSQKYMLSALKQRINDYPQKMRAVIVCTGDIAQNKLEFLMKQFQSVHTISKKIYINSSVVVGKSVYFTASNSNHLFIMDTVDCSVQSISIIPNKNNNILKSSTILLENNSLWIIPWMDKDIYVYNLHSDTMETIHFPVKEELGIIHRFRKAVLADGNIFLLPREGGTVLKINPQKRSVNTFDVSCYSLSDNVKNGYGYGGIACVNNNILFFGDQYNRSFIINSDENSIKDFPLKTDGGYVTTISNDMIMVIPTFFRSDLKVYNSSGKLVKVIELPEEVWGDKDTDFYWYSKVVRDHLYILSIEIGTIIIYGLVDDTVKLTKWPEDKKYDAIVAPKGFTGYDVLEIESKDEIWITSHTGNHILRLDMNGDVAGVIDLYVPLKELSVTGRNPGIMETRFKNLNVFLNTSIQKESTLIIE